MMVFLEWVTVVWFLGLVGSLDGDCELWTGSFSCSLGKCSAIASGCRLSWSRRDARLGWMGLT